MPVAPGSTKAGTPANLKSLRGAAEGNRNAPQVAPRIPEAPAHLDADERAAWERFAKLLTPLRVCGDEDFAALESLVTCWVQSQRLRAQLRRDAELGDKNLTYTTVTQTGSEVQRTKAALAALNEVDRRLKDWLGRFGLTPADRGRVIADGGGESGGTNPDDEFGGPAN